jgi:hypothetical protein
MKLARRGTLDCARILIAGADSVLHQAVEHPRRQAAILGKNVLHMAPEDVARTILGRSGEQVRPDGCSVAG